MFRELFHLCLNNCDEDYFLFDIQKYAYNEKPISYANRGVRSPCTPGSDGLGGATYCCSTNYCNGITSLSSSIGLIICVNLLKRILLN